MPSVKQELILALRENLRAFVRFEAGVGRNVPSFRELLDRRNRQVRSLQQRLGQERSRTEPQKAGRPSSEAAEGSVSGEARRHAIPEPDQSIRRAKVFRSLVRPLKPGRMLDLGAGPGTFSIIAAELGWKVDAVDARDMRVPDPEAQQDPARADTIRSISWIESDVRHFPIAEGRYDLVCIMGLMHHLELQDQLQLLRRSSNTLTLLTVRVAPEVEHVEGGYEGRSKREPGATFEKRKELAQASWENDFSFLPTEESLIRMARDCGYQVVMPMRPPHDRDYTFYLCVP